MSVYQTQDPVSFSDFFEIVKVGRWWVLLPDVTIYYISQTEDFQIFGGSKVKDTSTSDYLEITIAMHKFGCEGKFFTLRRYNQGGGYEVMPKGFYWIKKSLTQSV